MVGPRPETQYVDRLGALASTLCAVHCALSASLPEVLAAFGLGALLGHEVEWVFTLLAIGIATAALLWGWQKHRSPRVASALGTGIVALLLARLLEAALVAPLGMMLSVVAGLTLVVGHLSSISASRRPS